VHFFACMIQKCQTFCKIRCTERCVYHSTIANYWCDEMKRSLHDVECRPGFRSDRDERSQRRDEAREKQFPNTSQAGLIAVSKATARARPSCEVAKKVKVEPAPVICSTDDCPVSPLVSAGIRRHAYGALPLYCNLPLLVMRCDALMQRNATKFHVCWVQRTSY
jgi:hypothetical protein